MEQLSEEIADDLCTPANSRAIRDALDVLSGGWKLPILVSLSHGPKRFKEIARDVEGISDKMLSKELKSLELNLLVVKNTIDEFSSIAEYAATEHAYTLHEVMVSLSAWGKLHRKKITGK
ncbi:winged helix-turn-helix transcriptional regulator [Flavobacterium beibuense]|uniref:Transcriptional regulator, HxlR family n=1 Tax=Flavobacterium beibuense TaxID=657326 RepID=A0A444WEF7_9FLAO|nr:helix-turn-helix domain-containing protein [Flavobacterium beibuense]RYJ44217.1 Transcriptional regulator, HxlR family [Flavobacterium beibuense]